MVYITLDALDYFGYNELPKLAKAELRAMLNYCLTKRFSVKANPELNYTSIYFGFDSPTGELPVEDTPWEGNEHVWWNNIEEYFHKHCKSAGVTPLRDLVEDNELSTGNYKSYIALSDWMQEYYGWAPDDTNQTKFTPDSRLKRERGLLFEEAVKHFGYQRMGMIGVMLFKEMLWISLQALARNKDNTELRTANLAKFICKTGDYSPVIAGNTEPWADVIDEIFCNECLRTRQPLLTKLKYDGIATGYNGYDAILKWLKDTYGWTLYSESLK